MSDRMWRRLGAAGGIFYVVLTLLGNDVIGGTRPRTGLLVELLGFIFFAFFLGSLWACLRSAEGDGGWLSAAAFGGGLVALAVKLASVAPVLAVRASEGMDPGIAKALIAMNGASFDITFLPLGVMLLATAIVAVRTGALPRWLGWASAVVALGLLGALSAAVVSPSPPEWVFLAMLLFALWTVATSIVLIRRAGEPHPVQTAHLAGEPAHIG
jgi:Domain of unknown function (DUF4386)